MSVTETKTRNIAKGLFAFQALAFVGISAVATIYMMIATLAYFVMIWGLFYRKNKSLHPKLMVSAIGMDLSLVLVLQVLRDAVQTAASFSLGPFEQAHILFSTIATALYFPILYLGFVRWKGSSKKASTRIWHLRLGVTAFVFRSLGFALMFSML